MALSPWTQLIWQEAISHQSLLQNALKVHITLSITAVGLAFFCGLPLGFLSTRSPLLNQSVLGVCNTLRVIPGLAILVFMMPLLGTGTIPTLTALVILALPSVLLNTVAGFRQVGTETLETALALGMTSWQAFHRIEVPIALPYILTGLRIACVEVISGATLAAFIGGGGLGTLIVNGLSTYNFPLLIVGALPVALLALITELFFSRIIQLSTRYQAC
jgi:osmoprotectant transport system permease protein